MFTFDSSSRRTLKIVGLLWLVFFLFCAGGAVYLSRRVGRIEARRHPALAQPCFSENEEQVAYLSRPDGSDQWELWVVPLLKAEPRQLVRLEAGEWELLGWFDDDKRLLLRPRRQGAPRVLTVEVASASQKEIRFENEGVELVGVRGGQLYFERPGDDPQIPEIKLLHWLPGDQKLTQVARIPFETEKLEVESVWPSPDKRWLALVILMGDANPDRSLWLYDREQDHLSWTGIRLSSQAIRGAWSPDSLGLVAAVQTGQGCDIYAFWDVTEGKYTRLSSGEQSHAYQPFWPRGSKEFLLVENQRVYRFDPETLRAETLHADEWDVRKSRDLAVSPQGNYAAYIGPEDDAQQLYRVSFDANQRQRLLPAHDRQALRNQWWYILGSAFRNIFSGWSLL